MANRSRTLYCGVTSDLVRRVCEHRTMQSDSFTCRYLIDRLVYFEEGADIRDAIAREKQVKGWSRARKIELIESANPGWVDLSVRHGSRDRRDPSFVPVAERDLHSSG
jgi:putative endonuclease